MFSSNELLLLAKNSIAVQAEAVSGLSRFINNDFAEAVNILLQCKGRVVLTGIGKSAIIAQKIAATFNSTGTPALYMHAADAIHGDLGMVTPNDPVIIISKSGNSPEIKFLLPVIKNFGNKTIAICGNEQGFLAREADLFLNTTVEKEACPNNLAPTTSTTAQMVMGDALAICLMSAKGFTGNDFAKFHPGGSLGKQLYLRVRDLIGLNEKPIVPLSAGIREIIVEISGKRLGATAVSAEDGALAGIITDGDIRRMLQQYEDVDGLRASDILNAAPKTIEEDALAVQALELMRQCDISQLVVLRKGSYAGMLHVHDLLREGIM